MEETELMLGFEKYLQKDKARFSWTKKEKSFIIHVMCVNRKMGREVEGQQGDGRD